MFGLKAAGPRLLQLDLAVWLGVGRAAHAVAGPGRHCWRRQRSMGSAKSAMAPTGNRPFCGSAFWRVRVPTLEPDQQVAVAGLVRPIFPGAPDLDRIGAVAAVAGLDLVSIAIRRCSNSSNASPIVPTLPLSTGWPKIANVGIWLWPENSPVSCFRNFRQRIVDRLFGGSVGR